MFDKKSLCRFFIDRTMRVRSFNNACIRKFAKGVHGKKILEFGSGKLYRGEYYYSAKKYFDESNDFLQSDVVEEYGHQVLDVTKIDFSSEFDVILCMSVLEHVYDFRVAVDNIYRALKKGGTLVFFVPVFYPLHDEPYDYWRFTEHSIRKMFGMFEEVKIRHNGMRELPFAYYVEAVK